MAWLPTQTFLKPSVFGVEKAPPMLHLLEHEKFQDDDGNVLKIETRGERKHYAIFFKVHDVSKAFDIVYLYDSLVKKDRSYTHITDYVYFICEKTDNVRNTTTKKELFLTYTGMLRGQPCMIPSRACCLAAAVKKFIWKLM